MHLHLSSTPSTMADARRLLESGDTTTTLITTDVQTAARGRQGASWTTFPAPHSLACTLIIRAGAPIPHLALLTSLALHQTLLESLAPLTLQSFNPSSLSIKWPNDLLLNGKKLSGILIEALPDATYLIGIGLNLSPPAAPLDPQFSGVFLSEAGDTPPQPPELALAIEACLSKYLTLYTTQGWSAFHNNYLRACTTIGQKARWKRAGKQDLTGIARGLTKDGHLELETDDGQTHIIHSGSIIEETSPTLPK